MTTIIPVLGDQLSFGLSSLAGADPNRSVILMMELMEETRYVPHHRKKLVHILSAMRHHAAALRDRGWSVDYVALDDPANSGSFAGEVERASTRHRATRIVVTEPGEWRVRSSMDGWQRRCGIPVEIREDTRFIASHEFFAQWAGGRRQLRMEMFYREMRRRTGLLMHDGEPIGGRWNYDSENRKPPPAGVKVPEAPRFAPDEITRAVIALVEARFPEHPGSAGDFAFAVTAADAGRLADRFFARILPRFGDYQDAMLMGHPFLWHSLLSPALNAGLLDPLELCRRAEAEHLNGRAPLNAAEGFIRQILGWREFVRGIYWREGPDYSQRNFLGAHRPLPSFYWTGKTDLNCLARAIGQTLDLAYAHHIQRLMITGNFALLIGADPEEVHRWYLAVYADAYEWVELPNTLGMSQFADGGVLASKPYAASGAYVARMSDYCSDCRYDVKQRTGPDACPLNALYWDFLDRNRTRLSANHRLAMPYRTLDRMKPGEVAALRTQASSFLRHLDESDPRQ
jgi:deoxyribodipyrimidine photolyase-related protein